MRTSQSGWPRSRSGGHEDGGLASSAARRRSSPSQHHEALRRRAAAGSKAALGYAEGRRSRTSRTVSPGAHHGRAQGASPRCPSPCPRSAWSASPTCGGRKVDQTARSPRRGRAALPSGLRPRVSFTIIGQVASIKLVVPPVQARAAPGIVLGASAQDEAQKVRSRCLPPLARSGAGGQATEAPISQRLVLRLYHRLISLGGVHGLTSSSASSYATSSRSCSSISEAHASCCSACSACKPDHF